MNDSVPLMKNMGVLPIVEIFKSIEGEGKRTGLPTVFVRFGGCNLKCKYCDTTYAQSESQYLYKEELLTKILSYKCSRVTFTGGEPLLKGGEFIKWFADLYPDYEINIETNGSIDILSYTGYDNILITMDYKCPYSLMDKEMNLSNLQKLRSKDVLKFVVATDYDLRAVLDVIYNKQPKSKNIYLSPVFGVMDLQKMAKFVIDNDFLNLRVGLQIHKIIWDPKTRGV